MLYTKVCHGHPGRVLPGSIPARRDVFVGMLTTNNHMPTSEDVRGHGTQHLLTHSGYGTLLALRPGRSPDKFIV